MNVKPSPTRGPEPAALHDTAPAEVLPVTHYENFPVASWLCPPRLRPPIAALYHFARTADDIADEGDDSPAQRLATLAAYQAELHATLTTTMTGPVTGPLTGGRWQPVLAPLARQQAAWGLPVPLLDDLISAFMQDIAYTRDQHLYPDRDSLLDYCRRSANPIGRLLLHLHGVTDAQALAQSDDICSALQLINFWQDLSQDIPRGRHYLTVGDCQRHGVARSALQSGQTSPAILALIADNLAWAEQLMLRGAPLVHRLPGRAGWELRLVVQGGLRVLQRIRATGGNPLARRIKLGRADALPLLWRTLWM